MFEDAITPLNWLWEPEIDAEIGSQVQALVKGDTDPAVRREGRPGRRRGAAFVRSQLLPLTAGRLPRTRSRGTVARRCPTACSRPSFAPRPRRPRPASAADGAAGSRGRDEADARVGAGRVRQDDAARRVAGVRSRPARPRTAWLSLDQGDNEPSVRSGPTSSAALQRRGAGDRRERPRRAAEAPADAHRGRPRRRCSTSSARCPTTSCWCSTTSTRSTRRRSRPGWRSCSSTCPAQRPPRDRHPRRSRAAAGAPARAGRARRGPRRRPAVLARRGRRVPQRGDGARLSPRRTSRRWKARTEGWIAALQLAALSMQGRDDIAGFIAGFAGDDRYIVDYLMEEVLQRQPERGPELPARRPRSWPA